MSQRKSDPQITLESFTEGLWKNNPVFVMLLGMCPVLAVTNSAINALAMGLATTFVLVASGYLVSLLSRFIPRQVRIATYIVIIATFVTIIDYVIQAISPDLYNSLGAFIQLIVVNCMILGRAEAFASRWKQFIRHMAPPSSSPSSSWTIVRCADSSAGRHTSGRR